MLIPLASLLLAVTPPPPTAAPAPPPTRREPVTETLHGVEITDPYRWLEDQESPETRAWIGAQERHCRAVLDAIPHRAAIEPILRPLFHREDVSAPWVRGERLVFTRRLAHEQLPSIVVRDGERGRDRVLADPLDLDPDGKRSVQIQAVSDDGAIVALGIRAGGADEAELRFVDAATGREVAERLPSARYLSTEFSSDRRSLWYSVLDAGESTLRRHRFGTAPESDEIVFGRGLPPGAGVGALVVPGGWIVATVWHGSAARKSELHVRREDETGPFRPIVDDVEARFDPAAGDGVLFVRTTWDAPRGRVLAIDLAEPQRDRWREVIPQSADPLQDIEAVGGRIVARYLHDVRPVLRVHRPDGTPERTIELDAPGHVGNVAGRWADPRAFMTSSSWIRPQLIESLDVRSGARREWFREASPLPERRYVVEQHWVRSSDGARVPVFLGRARDAKPDGTAPVLVVGYGGFSLSQLPWFSPRIVAWLAMGGTVAMPSLRGGAEFGEEWHEQAMGARKQQTFDDLYATAEWLASSGWADPDRIALFGRSNGGLLVGAALTQRPELFRAVTCGYPLLDMLRYDKFSIARLWVPEYGSAQDPEQFGWLRAYSPYHNVRQSEKYPATLFVTGDADTRVAPLHARKMAALLQASTGSGHPVLLHYDTEMGHVGGLPADKELADLADELAFMAWQLGMEPPRADSGRRRGLGR